MSQPKRTTPSRSDRRASRRAERDTTEAKPTTTPAPTPADAVVEAAADAPDSAAESTVAASAGSAEAAVEAPTYTIDDLSATTGIPSRTIRFYQSSGVLSRPDKRGRIAYYGPQHIERLELIGKMQDRGLRMRAIKDLVEQIDAGEVVLNEWLGLEDQLSSAWIDDAPKVVSRLELDELLGERRPGFLAELVRAKLLEAQTEAAWLVASPGLLHVALELDDAGVAIDVATKATEILQRHLGKAARELAAMFADRAGDGFGKDDSVAGISDAYERLRKVGPDSVRLIFAREMEQVLRRMVETGEAARIDKKKRRSKAKR